MQAGDTVLVRAGVYHESVNIGVSGSAGAGPVTFESYPGETAILDGTGLIPSSSDTQGLFNIVNQSYITLEGFEIRNYTTSNANAIPAGIWVTGSGSNLQINIVPNSQTPSGGGGLQPLLLSLNSASADFLWNGTDHPGFTAYQSASGQDSHSQYADPLFLTLTTPNLQVESTSPAGNRGTNLEATIEGTLDFAGNPRALGRVSTWVPINSS